MSSAHRSHRCQGPFLIINTSFIQPLHFMNLLANNGGVVTNSRGATGMYPAVPRSHVYLQLVFTLCLILLEHLGKYAKSTDALGTCL